jgi:hypothetical protein
MIFKYNELTKLYMTHRGEQRVLPSNPHQVVTLLVLLSPLVFFNKMKCIFSVSLELRDHVKNSRDLVDRNFFC